MESDSSEEVEEEASDDSDFMDAGRRNRRKGGEGSKGKKKGRQRLLQQQRQKQLCERKGMSNGVRPSRSRKRGRAAGRSSSDYEEEMSEEEMSRGSKEMGAKGRRLRVSLRTRGRARLPLVESSYDEEDEDGPM